MTKSINFLLHLLGKYLLPLAPLIVPVCTVRLVNQDQLTSYVIFFILFLCWWSFVLHIFKVPLNAPLLLHRTVESGHSLLVIIPSVLLLGGGLHALRQYAPQATFVGISILMLCIGLSLRLSAAKALTLRAPVMYLLYFGLIYLGYHLLLEDYLWQPIALSFAAATLPFGTWLGDVLINEVEQQKTPSIVATRFYALSLTILPVTLLSYALIGLLPRSFFLAIIPLLLASHLISQTTKDGSVHGLFAFLTRTYPYLVIAVLILANII